MTKTKGRDKKLPVDKIIEEAGKESFPASDPVAWTLGTDHQINFSISKPNHDVGQILAYEHYVIKKMLVHINQLLKSTSQNINNEIKNIIEFFSNFVTSLHYPKEELLFKILLGKKQIISDYLLKDLNHEHEMSNELLSKLKKAYDANAYEACRHILKDLTEFHLNHTAKEDEYIFPLINKIIDDKQQNKLLEEFAFFNQKFGDQEYERMVHLVE